MRRNRNENKDPTKEKQRQDIDTVTFFIDSVTGTARLTYTSGKRVLRDRQLLRDSHFFIPRWWLYRAVANESHSGEYLESGLIA